MATWIVDPCPEYKPDKDGTWGANKCKKQHGHFDQVDGRKEFYDKDTAMEFAEEESEQSGAPWDYDGKIKDIVVEEVHE